MAPLAALRERPAPPTTLPGTGDVRAVVQFPEVGIFGVRGSTFSAQSAPGVWQAHGALLTTHGAVEMAPSPAWLSLRDHVALYTYTFATQVLAVVQTLPGVDLTWRYHPGPVHPDAFALLRRLTPETPWIVVAYITPVEPQMTEYHYRDTQVTQGATYTWSVCALATAQDGMDAMLSSEPELVTLTIPYRLPSVQQLTATFTA